MGADDTTFAIASRLVQAWGEPLGIDAAKLLSLAVDVSNALTDERCRPAAALDPAASVAPDLRDLAGRIRQLISEHRASGVALEIFRSALDHCYAEAGYREQLRGEPRKAHRGDGPRRGKR